MSADNFAALEHATPIVQVAGGVATTTSMRIANGTGNQHESVIRIIRTYLADFEEFGRVRFEIGPLPTAGGMQSQTVAVLTEEHATLLFTYMRNSDTVRTSKSSPTSTNARMVKSVAATPHTSSHPESTSSASGWAYCPLTHFRSVVHR